MRSPFGHISIISHNLGSFQLPRTYLIMGIAFKTTETLITLNHFYQHV